jgi:fructan beta-fructosidase
MKYLIVIMLSLLLLLSAKSDKRQYDETYRPQFHFSPEKNWMFQSNGFLFYKGEYHLFYHNISIGNKRFKDELGHAVSKDMLHWSHQPVALTLEDRVADPDAAQPTSGSAVIDSMNVTGFQQNGEKAMLIFYSDSKGNQHLAYSVDKGASWNKYAKNPILKNSGGEAHDPKVFYHAPTGKWVMALYSNPGDGAAKAGISFYNSADMLEWKFSSHLEGMGESPDLFEVAAELPGSAKKWVALSGEGEYKIGNFDGLTFNPETGLQKLDYGKNFFAAQTLFNAPQDKSILIAWMRGGEYTDMPFNGQMSFPTEVSLRTTSKGLVLCRKPIETISSIYKDEIKKKDKNFIPGLKGSLVGGIKGDAIFIRATFKPGTSDSFGFIVRTGKKSEGTDIHYDTAKKTLEVNGSKMIVEPLDGKIELEILLDRASIEIFANHGEAGLSTCFAPVQGEEELLLYTQGGELYLETLEAYNLKSVWANK